MKYKIDLSNLPSDIVRKLCTKLKNDSEIQAEKNTYVTYNYNKEVIYLHGEGEPRPTFLLLKIEEYLLSFLQDKEMYSEEDRQEIRSYLNNME